MILKAFIFLFPKKRYLQLSILSWAFLLFGSLLGVISALLLVSGRWQLAFGLVFILPASILIFKYPFLTVIIWLLLDPFLFTTTTAAGREVYWVVHRGMPPLTVAVLVVIYLLRIRKFPKLGFAEIAIVGYIGVSLISITLVSENPQPTLINFYDRVFSPVCLYFIVRLTELGENEINQLVPTIFFLGIAQGLIGIFSWFAPQFIPQQWMLRLAGQRTTGSLVSPGVYTSTIVFAGLFLMHAAFNRKPDRIRALYLAVFFLSVFSVFISFSRASWLAGIFVLIGLSVIYPRFLLRTFFLFAPIMILLMGILFTNTFSYAKERLDDSGTALSRLPVALASYRMFETKPLFGWGYGNFDYFDRQFQGRVGELVNAKKDLPSHNLYLGILAEQGIVGLALFLAPVLWWLFKTVKLRQKLPSEGFLSRNLLFLFWLVILDHFIVNNFSQMWVGFGYGMWWLTLGMIANLISTSTVKA